MRKTLWSFISLVGQRGLGLPLPGVEIFFLLIMKFGSNQLVSASPKRHLVDQGAISKDEFATLKVKILTDEYDYKESIADRITKLKGLYDATLLTEEEYRGQVAKLVNGK